MRYSCRFHDLTQKDYDEAFEWYEKQQTGLGDRFIEAVRKTIENIILSPETYGVRSNKKLREAKVDAFPYVIVYTIHKRSRVVFIVSVHHTSKNPRKKFRR